MCLPSSSSGTASRLVALREIHGDQAGESDGIDGDESGLFFVEHFAHDAGGRGFHGDGEIVEGDDYPAIRGGLFFNNSTCALGEGGDEGFDRSGRGIFRRRPNWSSRDRRGRGRCVKRGDADHERRRSSHGARQGSARPGIAEKGGLDEKENAEDLCAAAFQKDKHGRGEEAPAREDQRDAEDEVAEDAEFAGEGKVPDEHLEDQAGDADAAGEPDALSAGGACDGSDGGHGGDARDLPDGNQRTKERGQRAAEGGDEDGGDREFAGAPKNSGKEGDEGLGEARCPGECPRICPGDHHDGGIAKEKGGELSARSADAAELPELADAFLHAH